MNSGMIVVTKRRYNVLKAVLLFAVLSLEYLLVVGKCVDYAFSYSFMYIYISYMLYVLIFVIFGQNAKVYLKYEVGLSLMIKTVGIDCLMIIQLLAIQVPVRFWVLCGTMVLLMILNVLGIVLINQFMNWFIKKNYKIPDNILYICGEGERYAHLPGLPASLEIEALENAIMRYDDVYLIDVPAERRNKLLKFCYKNDKTVYCTAKLSDVLMRASGMTQDIDTPVYFCTKFGIGRFSERLKRSFDVVCSALALFVLAPLFAVVAYLIKKEDGGPVIYKQIRCTKDLKEFEIYKFRSMISDSEKNGAQLAIADDDRLTKIGRFIRETKIDELPQLVNILKGDMSIVGPRPERPELIRETIEQVPEFELRTKVKAGLTGYAQVRGYYNTDFLDKLKWDLIYIENYSFLLDIKIIIMTVSAIVSKNIK